jgi:hypothetical protein
LAIFAESQTDTSINKISVLFTIILNLEKSRWPLVYIAHLSAVRGEEETLVAMGSVLELTKS